MTIESTVDQKNFNRIDRIWKHANASSYQLHFSDSSRHFSLETRQKS